MMETGYLSFARSYQDARERFREAATDVNAHLEAFPIENPSVEDLTIDVATFGNTEGPTLVTSSGVHGVEGFMGSAIQFALLQQIKREGVRDLRYVFIHAVNPFGFAELRRFNEINVDLNRNFPSSVADYCGAPAGYVRLNEFLNPTSPPPFLEFFRLKAIAKILRFGLQPLKQAIAGGQYDFEQGIFFGGTGPCQSTRIVCEHMSSWLGHAGAVVHIDFHSGLGKFSKYKLLLSEASGTPEAEWYSSVFGEEYAEASAAGGDRTAYQATGGFGEWLQETFSNLAYRFVTAEFGTYDPIRVLGAIRAENRACHYSNSSRVRKRVKQELLECFCPSSREWRNRVVASGLRIAHRSAEALLEMT